MIGPFSEINEKGEKGKTGHSLDNKYYKYFHIKQRQPNVGTQYTYMIFLGTKKKMQLQGNFHLASAFLKEYSLPTFMCLKVGPSWPKTA